MPRVKGTRKQKAAELLNTLQRGPQLGHPFGGEYSPQEAMEQCQQWLRSWVTPLVKELVPELRRASTTEGTEKLRSDISHGEDTHG